MDVFDEVSRYDKNTGGKFRGAPSSIDINISQLEDIWKQANGQNVQE